MKIKIPMSQSNIIYEIEKHLNIHDTHTLIKSLTAYKPNLNEDSIEYLKTKTNDLTILNILDKFLASLRVIYGNNSNTPETSIEKFYGSNIERNKHMKLLFNSLIIRINDPNYEYTAKLVKDIYNLLTKYGKNTKTEIFSRYSNLKNIENNLAENIYDGLITPKEFVDMTTEDMKGDNLRNLEAKLLEKGIFDSTVPEQKGETDVFKCPKCKQRKAVYWQLQTRSADEPMTTFIKCCCGFVWKF